MSATNATAKSSRKKKSKAILPPSIEQLSPEQNKTVLSIARRDDLLNIEGINPDAEMALNGIGIWRFADFRGYTPETLAQALRERAGLAISAQTIASQDWLGWAELFAVESSSAVVVAAVDEKMIAAAANSLEEESREAQTEKTENIPLEDAVQPDVESQESAVPIETRDAPIPTAESQAEKAATPSEVEAAVLKTNEAAVRSVLKKPPVAHQGGPMKKEKPETQNESNDETVLSIQQVRFSQAEMPAKPSPRSVKLMRSEIACHVNGGKALRTTTDRVALCAQILAVDTVNGEYKLLASQLERFQFNRADYRFYIEFEVPQVGRYQLQIVTFLLQVNPKIAFHPGPILRVVP